MNCTRRNFLIGGSTTLFLSGYFPKISFASMQKKNLIIISLRGGMDGLTAVPVIGDKRLKKLRKKLILEDVLNCLLYTSPSPRDSRRSRMPSSA